MRTWEAERDELLGFVAAFAEAMWDDGQGAYDSRVRQNIGTLEGLITEISAHSPAPGLDATEAEPTRVVDSLRQIRAAAMDQAEGTTGALLSQLRQNYPVDEYTSAELFGYLAELTEDGPEDVGSAGG